MEARLPAHLEASALIRAAESEGGFGMVIQKGERDAGTILVVLLENGRDGRVYERMPQMDGTRLWTCAKREESPDSGEFSDYLERRRRQDPDLWVIELDVARPERLIGIGT
ncbi:hypothetical protein EDF56_10481 [Novosphingobium sp. PhB165]|uniref:DUF1491 family protein n=1 Tax=Novosphingobium sp. PhB165 TaxID=2485105 RepID=UPI0010456134|nr:DUF1491 family protein [Novosphingobium sp. PhB165]TCM18551.1 hypothetical protein EDF56_10481 [Novosphingobium sp. PhB165]